ncbi:LysR family transcriptional regulator [Chitinibacteraceae bacterium HSL-7]
MLRASLEQWRMFVAVADAGGFNQAAEAVFKSQSSIHHAVHKLEEQLSVSLLVAEGRRVRLTRAGETLLRRARWLLDEAGAVEAVAERLGQGVESRVALAVDQSFPLAALQQAMADVAALHPHVRVDVHETVLSGADVLLEDGVVDLAISPSPANDQRLGEVLGVLEFVAVASPDHPLHGLPAPLGFDDLAHYRQIVVRDSALDVTQEAGWLGAEQRWTVSHLSTSLQLLMSGAGYAWLPWPHITEAVSADRLRRLPGLSTRRHALYLHYRDADLLGPVAQLLVQALRAGCWQNCSD